MRKYLIGISVLIILVFLFINSFKINKDEDKGIVSKYIMLESKTSESNEILVEFIDNDTIVKSVYVSYGESITLPYNLNDGFIGWKLNNQTYEAGTNVKIIEHSVFYAVYHEVPSWSTYMPYVGAFLVLFIAGLIVVVLVIINKRRKEE